MNKFFEKISEIFKLFVFTLFDINKVILIRETRDFQNAVKEGIEKGNLKAEEARNWLMQKREYYVDDGKSEVYTEEWYDERLGELFQAYYDVGSFVDIERAINDTLNPESKKKRRKLMAELYWKTKGGKNG